MAAIRSNRSWLTYTKGDPVLNQRLTTALLEERQRFLKMKTQNEMQRPLSTAGTFRSNTRKIVIRKPENYYNNAEFRQEILEKPKVTKLIRKIKSVKNNYRNK
ncbi:unnamed protein product, partial [Acanthoscelides obtectus]